jgi:CRISPR-associated protein Csd1
MSWLQRLSETYDACFGREQFASRPLAPIDHVEQQAHIEIVLDAEGALLRASIVPKESTLIPATERSAGRTSGPVAHPLCDKLRYIAADYHSPSEDDSVHSLYLEQLRGWVGESGNPKLRAVLQYVEHGSVVRDLLDQQILSSQADGTLETAWEGAPPALARLLTQDAKTRQRDQGDALIRWRVELPSDKESAVWKDVTLQQDWVNFNAGLPAVQGLCLSTGKQEPLAFSHPKRLRHGGDGAKLISTNDEHGFTFRGRFLDAKEAYGLGSATTQKAHNALRWLIARQGTRLGEQTIVSWSVAGDLTPPVVVNSAQLFAQADEDLGFEHEEEQVREYQGDAGQAFARRLNRLVRGYGAALGERSDIVVMALDSATPGRMAILYYRELKRSEFLERVKHWHSALAWPQNFGKDQLFVGAPAPRDVAQAAFGVKVEGKLGSKLLAATVERLLPCIVDGRPLPRDLERSAVLRASNRAALEPWEWERVLGVACSLVRGAHPEEHYSMNLEENRTSRDYLYGRLLAIADSIEAMALRVARESRDTNAARLMQRFADHPYTTWRTLELQLRPYIARLRSSRPAPLAIRLNLLDSITNSFQTNADGESAYMDNRRLSGEFLLGYHSQREALRPKKDGNTFIEKP